MSSESSPLLAQLGEHGVVLVRAADRRHARVVLRRRPQHRRAADVDHLDGVLLAHAPAPGDLRERIEVHAHELERPDAELVERERVLLAVGPREDRRVHLRVQRLHAPAEELAGPGQLLDERHAELVLLDEAPPCLRSRRARRRAPRGRARTRRGRSCRRRRGARARSLRQLAQHLGYRRCSTACRRSRSDAACLAALDRHPLLGDDRARVDALVHPVDGNAGLGRSRPRARPRSASVPGKAGSSAGWMLTMRCGKRARNAGVSRYM